MLFFQELSLSGVCERYIETDILLRGCLRIQENSLLAKF
jgi:hypothetical protein